MSRLNKVWRHVEHVAVCPRTTNEVITDVITVKTVSAVQTHRELLVRFRATCLQPDTGPLGKMTSFSSV